MLAYRLRHRVTFQRQVHAQDPGTGADIVAWQDAVLPSGAPLVDVPAEVLTGAGKEFVSAATKNVDTTARINLRWFPGLEQDWRVLWDGRVYDIQSIETDVTGRREWRLRCVDGPSEGV
ncbi:phage head closure protein [Cupriavidus gilardii]|uniref:phage head closure protein n=1 Tax=Cupriavidus gilardii TaxID=82541 RepID=UPI0021B499F3|nr:phage head closure protein [Cupriavidus gilardii]UXC34783.1 phage head closure protein [Cupriavidus gilardii]UXC37349.1 phage head closure protein [Cupriavidus gilardii]